MTNEAGRKMWVIAVAILVWNLAGSTGLGRNLSPALGWNLGLASTAQAAPQVDPTTNFRMWGSPSFNRQIGPDDEIMQVASGSNHTVALLTDGSVACWGSNGSGQCTVPSGIGTPENPVVSIAAAGNMTVVATAPQSAIEDCNENGVDDADEIADGSAEDCNGNDIIDSCELADGTAADVNLDGILDECQSTLVFNVPLGESIQAAIDLASDGDLIQLDAGEYSEGVQIDTLGKAISVSGTIDDDGLPTSVLDGGGTHRVLICQSGETDATVFENLVIQNGYASNGGGMYNLNSSSPSLINCTFLSNSADWSGGGIYNFGVSEQTLEDCRFFGNSAGYGGGIHFSSIGMDASVPTLSNCTFASNSASAWGGGISLNDSSPVISNCRFLDNIAMFGGGLNAEGASFPRLENCEFLRNTASSRGGAVETFVYDKQGPQDPFLHAQDCIFSENSAGDGGAIGGENARVDLIRCVFAGNSARNGGGTNIQENSGSSSTLTDCTFTGNSASNIGGGMYSYGGSPALANCTFTSNSAMNEGGGMWNQFDSIPSLVGNVVCGNLPDQISGNWSDEGGNCIVASCVDCFVDDCNENGIDDADEIADGSAEDCNGNDIIDSCELADGTAADVNLDGILDECQGTLVFNVPGSFATIASAIDAAPDGSMVSVISLDAGTYNEAVDFGSKNLVVQGDASNPSSVVLDGTGLETSVVSIVDGQDSTSMLIGLTIANGGLGSPLPNQPSSRAGGGLFVNDSTPVIEHCRFVDNTSGFGGGTYFLNSDAVIRDVEFIGNRATTDGGAIFIFDSAAEIIDVHMVENIATNHGGAAKLVYGETQFMNCDMFENQAFEGGGVYWFGGPDVPALVIDGCSIQGNTAIKEGGGIKARVGYPGVALSDSIVCENLPGQIDGSAEDLGGNCLADLCLDSDADGTIDCFDECPDDPNKTDPGACGCGVEDTDSDGDGIVDCLDPCPTWPYDCSEDGQTITVAVGQSIQQAIDAVPDGGTVAIEAGVFPLTSPLDPGGRAMTIRGPTDADANPTAILDGQSSTRVLICQNGETSATVFENLVIQNGDVNGDGGGMYNVFASPSLTNCVFFSNAATGSGGGVFNDEGTGGSHPVLTRCTFLENTASGYGGGIGNYYGGLSLFECEFIRNVSTDGGGGVDVFAKSLVVVDSVFTENSGRQGGGVKFWSPGGGEISLETSIFTGNVSTHGGGLYVASAFANIVSCEFTGNSAGLGMGGGLSLLNSGIAEFSLAGCAFSGNSAGVGGGVHSSDGSLSLVDCDFATNASSSVGGAIAATVWGLSANDCSFESNSSGDSGGAIYVAGAMVSLSDCLILGNSADSGGGGVLSALSSLSLVRCLVSENTAGIEGGGVLSQSEAGVSSLADTTICSNEIGQFVGTFADEGGNCISDVCDSDADGTRDCFDECPDDPNKTDPGACGCGVEDTDSDGDGVPDCVVGSIDSGLVWSSQQGGNGHLYSQVSFNTGVTWAEARAYAISLGANLTSFDNDAESIAVKAYLVEQDVSRGWIGLYQDVAAPDYAEPAGGWRWSDGTEYAYVDWLPGEPSDASIVGEAENFGMLAAPNNQPPLGWNDKAGRLAWAMLEWSEDCDGNGIVDRIEILAGGDCNGNGELDACDVLSGTSEDINRNLVPDECEDTLTFSVPGGFGTIAEAIDTAPSGSIISLSAGTYNEAVDFGSKNLVLQGDASDPSSVVLDGTGLETSVVSIVNGQNASSMIIGVTIANGSIGSPFPGQPTIRVGGGLFVYNASPVIQDCEFISNSAGFGGGVYLRGGAAEIRFCSFLGNTATTDGGAIFGSDTYGVIANCVVTGNTAVNHGGGIKVVLGGLEIVDTAITGNGGYQGGGLYWFANAGTLPLRVTGCTITGNTASKVGGGIKSRIGYPAVDLMDTTVCDNNPDEIDGEYLDNGGNTLCICVADFTGDGVVSGADLGLLLGAWGECNPDTQCFADLTGDGFVTGADLGLLLGAWGVCVDP